MGMSIVEGYLGSKLNYAVEAEIKQKLLEKALHMRCADLDKLDAGTLVSRVTSDSSAVISFVFELITSL
jgi:ABC-type multidrug transport system fused ATPase/permease subunit